jgi:hypothetical protein
MVSKQWIGKVVEEDRLKLMYQHARNELMVRFISREINEYYVSYW